ncbi:trimethylamine methyltransferase family protein [candidate division KSB1 bacterium]|nr:trimethylamine methyltransferase family protein [candidate division KSB1 bacterium]
MTDTERMRPQLLLLTPATQSRLYEAAIELLGRFGVWFEDSDARQILLDAGAIPMLNDKTRVLIKPDLIEKTLKTTPAKIMLHNARGDNVLNLSDENCHYVPGSAALNLFDWGMQKERPVETDDLLSLIKITNRLEIFDVQATSLVPSDIPQILSDCYRLYLSLLFSDKPIVSGLFQFKSFQIINDLLTTVRGNQALLEAKPLAILDCCPISPLRWGELSCQTLMACAENGIPAELVPMLLPGATAPIDLYSAFVQYLAEVLSGIVLMQTIHPGAPLIAGNAPAIFDMRTIAPAVGRTEAMLYMAGCAQLTKGLNLPTHTYACVSDTKILDIETGFESGIGALTAATSGINLIAGAGMLSSLNSFSFEKLLIDHEILKMIDRFKAGILPHPDRLIEQFFDANENDNTFLTVEKTINLYRQEYIYPAPPFRKYPAATSKNLSNLETAHQQVQDMITTEISICLNLAKVKLLSEIIYDAGKSIGFTQFPFLWLE